jgi:hypothetical protein
MARVKTDEWCGYNGLPVIGRSRATVRNAAGEWARDDDEDEIREVHLNTLEGLWTGSWNFQRPSRGMNKVYLHKYTTMFEWGSNAKRATAAFPWALLGVKSATICPTRAAFLSSCALRSDVHEEAPVKTGARRLRDFPDIHL